MLCKGLMNALLALPLLTGVALADERMDSAIKALAAMASSSEQLQRYCAIMPESSDVDAVRAEEISIELGKFWASLGPDYEALGKLEGEFTDTSPEAAILEAAFDDLEKKCVRN